MIAALLRMRARLRPAQARRRRHGAAWLLGLCATLAWADSTRADSGKFQFLYSNVIIHYFSDANGQSAPIIEGDTFVADVRSGTIFHCNGKFGVRRVPVAAGKPEMKLWTPKSMLCTPTTYDPPADPAYSDYLFGPVLGQVEKNTYGSFFRLSQTFRKIAFCTLDQDTIMRCTAEVELK